MLTAPTARRLVGRHVAIGLIAAFGAAACAGASETEDAAAATPSAVATAPDATVSPPPNEAGETSPPAVDAETAPPSDVAAGSGTASESVVAFDDPAAQAAADAWSEVFDSSVPVDQKVEHLPGAPALRPTLEAYAAAGEAVGGISLRPTDVTVDGDKADITYDVLFGDAAAYTGQTGSATRADDVWVVGRDEFCAFAASARVPCE